MSAKLKGKITSFERVGNRYAILHIALLSQPQPQLPGQYVHVSFSLQDDPFTRTYSIASAPRTDGSFDLCVQINDERMQTFFENGAPSDQDLELSAPAGNFFVPPLDTATVLLAGGSGITPLKAILEVRAAQRARSTLLYACADDAEIPFYEELKALESPQVKVLFFADKVTLGRAQAGRIAQRLMEFVDPKAVYLLCGPPLFIESTQTFLLQAGIPLDRIHRDRY